MSAASDAREKLIADNISALRIPGLVAIRPPADVRYADVKLNFTNRTVVKETWLEVKMNHTDNLGNVRVFWDGKKWGTSTRDGMTPLKQFMVDLLNKGKGKQQADKFLNDLAAFVSPKTKKLNKNNIKVPTVKGGLAEAGAISREEMAKFIQRRGGQYFINVPNVDLGELVIKHYNSGKAAPVSYLQAADDFYLLGDLDQLNLKKIHTDIPVVTGTGNFKMRIGMRTEYYELQPEIKILKMGHSAYSLLSASKKNP
ncbi:hypothetical protein EB118_26230, partial [bacterium]|nr:hypothetical protein [bacterium]